MKKLIAILLACFISFAAFTEEFKLFPNHTFCGDVTSYFITNGWKLSLNNFHNHKITSLTFSIDKEGFIQTQTIVLGNPPRSSFEAYIDMMEIACDYKTTFTKQVVKNDEGINYAYYANTPEYNTCLFMISGIEDMYLITLLFGQLTKE